ncbi:MAG: LysR family transcriptional regulator [Rhodospirillaceae bacterium]
MGTNLRRLDLTQLDYLRHVDRAGGVTAAATALNVAPQTISGQIQVLEQRLGQPLLERVGRGVQLTDAGRMVLEYGADMLKCGEDLLQALEATDGHGPARFAVGVGELVPKLVVRRLLRPVTEMTPMPQLVCREGSEDSLIKELVARRLDALILSSATPPDLGLENMLLAKSDVSAYGVPALAKRYRQTFPNSLQGAPMLLPTQGVDARRLVDTWFASRDIVPHVVGEFDDAALREVFGAAGTGLFLAPSLVAEELKALYGVEHVGLFQDLVARYFLVSPPRKRRLPAEAAIRAASQADANNE